MLSNVTHSHFYFECNKERSTIDQLYIELGVDPTDFIYECPHIRCWAFKAREKSLPPTLFKVRPFNSSLTW